MSAILAAPRRLAVYRSLVRNGLSAVFVRMLPRTRSRMNASCDGRFDADLARFIDEVGPRTHYLRDVPAEMFAWVEALWRGDINVPAYLPDLAAHELACFAVAASEIVVAPAQSTEIALDRPLIFAESTRLMRYAWAVQELPADDDSTAEPARRDVVLLAYRDPHHRVRWLELTPLAAAIVDRLVKGQPLGEAVSQACARGGVAPAAVLTDIARLLADLGARGVIA